MPVVSVIVEMREDSGEAVLSGLARIHNAAIYGIKDDKAVVVIEGDDLKAIEDGMTAIRAIEEVSGVYPVFSASD
jgi:nitrate reductase NapAB chaperone NapD